MRSRFSRSARETAWSMALGGLGSFGMRILTGFRGEIARFVILKARCQGVNHQHVPLCPEVTHFTGESSVAVTSGSKERKLLRNTPSTKRRFADGALIPEYAIIRT